MTRITHPKTTHLRKKTANSGFTMVELLAVVAILALLSLIAVFSLTRLRLDLRQRELDSKAELIYVAAQNQMAELKAAGWEGRYQKGSEGVAVMDFPPSDADEDSQNTTFCYVLANTDADKETTAALAVLPASAVDAELWGGCWCIEYAPDSGSVYAVFYSPDTLPDAASFDDYRSFQYRRRMGAKVGYYGGDIAQTMQTGALQPSLTIENAEKLIATFYCNRPTEQPITLTIQLSDGSNTYTRTVAQTQLNQIGSRLYRYTWVLDDLTRESTRFYAQTEGKLTCGTALTVTLTASSADPLVDQVSVSAVTNSLFDDRSGYGTGSETALLSYGRHLANLDASSHVTAAVTAAMQISDISFLDDTANEKDWYSYYGPSFTPITNSALRRYTGLSQMQEGTAVRSAIYGLNVTSSAAVPDVGLFASFTGSIDNVTLTGVQASSTGGYAGALIGRTGGAVTLESCAVYLNARRGDLNGLSASSPADVPARIRGARAGGLVGGTGGALTVRGSFAATTISGTAAAGGLVGYAGGQVSLSRSYADCYLTAPATGGLVGSTAAGVYAALVNCYAVGYQTAVEQAAGLVNGTLSRAEACYSACSFYGTGTVYLTAVAARSAATSVENVFYLRSDLSGSYQHLDGTDGKTYEEMGGDDFLDTMNRLYPDAFAAPSGSDSHPYNLLNQGLSTYSYPRLAALEHYGDWQAEFESDALVYYEAYRDGTYGFFGGNVDSLRKDGVIVGDGYAVALSQLPAAGWTLTVACGGETLTLDADSTRYRAAANGETYYLFPVSFSLNATAPAGTAAAFRQAITVGDRTYYFNPFFAKTVTTGAGTPDTVYLRTARHLYAMSRYYGSYAAATAGSTFLQERDIDYTTYNWTGYTTYAAVTQQTPIDSADGFVAAYDGDRHTVSGVSIVSGTGSGVGLFAAVARSGQVRDLAVLGQYDEAVRLTRRLDGSTVRIYAGVLAGRNYGIIANCAVSGYGFEGISGNRDYGLVAYNYSTLYIGGLVGGNFASGSSRNGTLGIFSCESSCPDVTVSAYNASVYAGGLTGSNTGGTIQSSYAVGSLYAKDVSNSTVLLGGFTGDNSGGILRYCYSATALTAAGEAQVYGLTRLGGSSMECYYLNGGTYSYGNRLYAYNTAANSFSANAAGRPITGAELEKLRLSGFSQAAVTRYDGTGSYPYPAVVRGAGSLVTHYGSWPTLEHIGTLGVFYWEYESGGSTGYHLSYVGTDNGSPISGSSLCTQHNDGGTVTRYGYGYFYKTDTVTSAADIAWTHDNCKAGTRRSEVEQALAAQMKGYSFVAYETGWEGTAEDTMFLTNANVNSQWTLVYDGNVYTYSVCPFFADAISLVSVSIGTNTIVSGSAVPGAAEDSAYQIRSVAQLQNINWNYGTRSADHSIMAANYRDGNLIKYPYLGSYQDSSKTALNNTRRYWRQSHDLDAAAEYADEPKHLFTPIGNMVDTDNTGGIAKPYVAYFASDYDGGAYTIRNIQIQSTAQCVGLFGFTVGANLSDIVMYSDQDCEIINDTSGTGWYAVGGLVGFAGAGTTGAAFTNCSVSGYTIRDIRSVESGWGGGCVGGLVGSTNMDITGCTAVTDIILNIGYDTSWNNLRVGGIAGVCRATLDQCYAGGSITAMAMKNNHNIGSDGGYYSTSIWAGGLVGGVIMRDMGNLETSMGITTRSLIVKNCYSFVTMPPRNNNTNKNHVQATYSIACNGEMLNRFSTTNISHTSAYIYNSYALISNIENTDDYSAFKGRISAWSSYNRNVQVYQDEYGSSRAVYGQNINTQDTSNQKRRVMLINDRSPYITYADMRDDDKLLQWLNDALTADQTPFSKVTVEENGARIDGKYSFPGADAQRLNGLNYPFPTILTQQDAYGRTVCVHYGAWPMYGLYWESTNAVLDLFADRNDGGSLPSLTVALYPESSAINTGSTPDITFWNEDGSEADGSLIGGVAVARYSATQGCWLVTFTASGTGDEGMVIARASINGFTAQLTIRVGAVLELSSDKPNGLTVYYGGPTETVTLSLQDSRGVPVTADAAQGELIEWTVSAEQLADGTAIVECSKDDIRPVAGKAGTFTLPVAAFAAGDSSITVTCTYTYLENGVQKSITASTLLSARSVRDAVGLVYDVQEDTALRTTVNGVYLPYAGAPENTNGGDVTAPVFDRQAGSLYLFAGKGYTDLNDFYVDFSGLTATDSEGDPSDDWTIRVGSVTEADDCRFRPLTVEMEEPRRLTFNGTVLLTRDGVTYRLTLTDYVCGTDPEPPETSGASETPETPETPAT